MVEANRTDNTLSTTHDAIYLETTRRHIFYWVLATVCNLLQINKPKSIRNIFKWTQTTINVVVRVMYRCC